VTHGAQGVLFPLQNKIAASLLHHTHPKRGGNRRCAATGLQYKGGREEGSELKKEV
jgi:hypothetical protein